MPFEEEVKTVIEKMTQDEKGNWTLPADVQAAPEVLYAAKLEKRFRDTQGAFTKAQQRAKELEITNGKLTEHLVNNATLHLTDQQAEELDQLKKTDLDSWRNKVNEYEGQARSLLQAKATEFHSEAQKATELERRKEKLQQFTTETGIEVTDELISTRLPSKVLSDLQTGKITYDDFLKEVKNYVKPTVIAGTTTEPEEDIDLGKLPGGSEPAKKDVEKDFIASYKKEVY